MAALQGYVATSLAQMGSIVVGIVVVGLEVIERALLAASNCYGTQRARWTRFRRSRWRRRGCEVAWPIGLVAPDDIGLLRMFAFAIGRGFGVREVVLAVEHVR